MLSSKKKDLKYLSDGVAGKYVKKDTPPEIPALNVWTTVNQPLSKKIISLTRRHSDKSTKENPRPPPPPQPTSLAQKCAKASQSQISSISKVNQNVPASPNMGPLQRPAPVLQINPNSSIGAQRGLPTPLFSSVPTPPVFTGKTLQASKLEHSSRLVPNALESCMQLNTYGQPINITEESLPPHVSPLPRFESHIYVNHYVKNASSENDCRICEVDNDGIPIKSNEDNNANLRCVTVPAAVSIIEVPGYRNIEAENPPEIAYQQDDSIQIHLYHHQNRDQYSQSLNHNAEQFHMQSSVPATSTNQLAST